MTKKERHVEADMPLLAPRGFVSKFDEEEHPGFLSFVGALHKTFSKEYGLSDDSVIRLVYVRGRDEYTIAIQFHFSRRGYSLKGILHAFRAMVDPEDPERPHHRDPRFFYVFETVLDLPLLTSQAWPEWQRDIDEALDVLDVSFHPLHCSACPVVYSESDAPNDNVIEGLLLEVVKLSESLPLRYLPRARTQWMEGHSGVEAKVGPDPLFPGGYKGFVGGR